MTSQCFYVTLLNFSHRKALDDVTIAMSDDAKLVAEIEALGEKLVDAKASITKRFIGQERVVDLHLVAELGFAIEEGSLVVMELLPGGAKPFRSIRLVAAP